MCNRTVSHSVHSLYSLLFTSLSPTHFLPPSLSFFFFFLFHHLLSLLVCLLPHLHPSSPIQIKQLSVPVSLSLPSDCVFSSWAGTVISSPVFPVFLVATFQTITPGHTITICPHHITVFFFIPHTHRHTHSLVGCLYVLQRLLSSVNQPNKPTPEPIVLAPLIHSCSRHFT